MPIRLTVLLNYRVGVAPLQWTSQLSDPAL